MILENRALIALNFRTGSRKMLDPEVKKIRKPVVIAPIRY